MSDENTFYVLTVADSNAEFGLDANVCIVTVTPERLEIWEHAFAGVMSLKSEQADVFKLTLHTIAVDFVDNDPLQELLSDEPILVKDIPLEWTEKSSLRGHLVNVYDDGEIMFECHNKHDGSEYYSKMISLQGLLEPEFTKVDWEELKAEESNEPSNV